MKMVTIMVYTFMTSFILVLIHQIQRFKIFGEIVEMISLQIFAHLRRIRI